MKTTLQVPIDKKVKAASEKAAREFGYSSLQELVRVFLKQFSKGVIVPAFSTSDEFLAPEEESVLTEKYREAREKIARGKGFSARSARNLISNLDAD